MADEENKIKKWVYKWKKDKGDTVKDKLRSTEPEDNVLQAEANLQGENKGTLEENLRSTEPEDNVRQAEPNLQGENKGTLEENLRSTEPEDNVRQAEANLRQAEQNFRREAATVDKDRESGDSSAPKKQLELERGGFKPRRDNSKMAEKGKGVINKISHKPVVITLVIVAIVLGGFLLYSQMQLSNQSYKIQNFNANWNQSLSDLRNGTTSLTEYCNNRVHDEDLCNRFMNLQYMN